MLPLLLGNGKHLRLWVLHDTSVPIGSMYALFTYMNGEKWPHSRANASKYSLHGSFELDIITADRLCFRSMILGVKKIVEARLDIEGLSLLSVAQPPPR